MLVFRYLLYLAFVVAALVFWLIVGVLVLGFSMGDPACIAEGLPCPVPSHWEHGAQVLLIFSIMPLTALGFVFYRRAVRRVLRLD
jgi:ABC-type uncharacterized transport system permease subunit